MGEATANETPVDQFLARQIRHVAVVMGGGGIGVLLLVVLARGFDIGASIVWPVAILGSLGGVASNILRLQRLKSSPEVVIVEIDQRLATAQIYFSPILGGLFASLLYLVFLSGILRGDFFPTFECATDPYDKFENMFCSPSSKGGAALMLVWSFVAGFAERFVPNVLDGLASHSSERNQ